MYARARVCACVRACVCACVCAWHHRDRIYEAGGFVLRGRVCAALAVARAFGDHQFKDPMLPQEAQMVTPCPDITFIDRNTSDDEFLVIACDGVYVTLMTHPLRFFFFGGGRSRGH